MFEKLASAETRTLLAWMVGAGMTGFGLGASVAPRVRRYAFGITAIGVILHGWAMYKIYVQS